MITEAALFDVNTVEHTWIPLPDGTRLSARLRLPATDEPQPAILEYLPYRKDDATLPRDNMNHDYMAARGYAMVRVDIRGSGDSDGTLQGEYLASELADGVEVIAWIAEQPWCDGKVGMMGISWGGFNALQVAAMRPPALQAVVSVASTVDRYADDVHYRGGCVLGTDMLAWAATMLCYNARPPTPRVVGERWRELWLERLERAHPFIDDWLTHQRRDDFWQHGSICEDHSAIRCPVLVVGGFADGYTDTVFKAIAGLSAAAKGMVGPWSHNYPNVGVPGPNIGFLQELLRWWDEHLRGRPGPGDGEQLRVWMHDWTVPATFHQERPGRWVAESQWPPVRDPLNLWLNPSGLASVPPPDSSATSSNTHSYGIRAGEWWGYAGAGRVAGDQRAEEAAAFAFGSAPTDQAVEILGMPRLELDLSVDVPIAQVSARLCDVAPDGSSLLVSVGFLNLTHRTSHEHPEPVTPGERFHVTVELDAVAHSLPPGHRWELHIGTGLWPLAWPAPRTAELTIFMGPQSFVALPVRPRLGSDDLLRPFDLPEAAPARRVVVEPPTSQRTITEDASTGLVTITDVSDGGRLIVDEHGTEIAGIDTDIWQIRRADPLSARVMAQRSWEIRWGETHVQISTESEMWADSEQWHTSNRVVAVENGSEIFSRDYAFSTPRDLN